MKHYFTWYIIITKFRILYRFIPNFWQKCFSLPFEIGESTQTCSGHSSYNNSEYSLPLLVSPHTNTQHASCHLCTLEASRATCKVFCSASVCSCACYSPVHWRSRKNAFFFEFELLVSQWQSSTLTTFWLSRALQFIQLGVPDSIELQFLQSRCHASHMLVCYRVNVHYTGRLQHHSLYHRECMTMTIGFATTIHCVNWIPPSLGLAAGVQF